MKKQLFSFVIILALLVPLINSCAGRDEPQMSDTARPDTMQATIVEDTGSAIAMTPRPHTEPDREHYILASDSGRLTRDGSTVWIMVRGPLGDGCQRYEYFDSVARGSTLYLTFWASRPTDSNVVCTQQMQYYDKEVRIENSPYTTFSVLQPDGRTSFFTLTNQISQK